VKADRTELAGVLCEQRDASVRAPKAALARVETPRYRRCPAVQCTVVNAVRFADSRGIVARYRTE
jgi:hypothetical protein